MRDFLTADFRNSRGRLRQSAVGLLLGLSLVTIVGCGKSGPPPVPREDVAGTVTFDGSALPFGYIEFRNEELQTISTIPIKEGAYKSETGQGPAAGKNKVYVSGSKEEEGMPLWTGAFTTEMEIAKGKNDGKDVAIEKKAVKPYNPKKWSDNEHDRS